MGSRFLKQNATGAIAGLKHLGQRAAGAAVQTACAVGLLTLWCFVLTRNRCSLLAKSRMCIH